MMRILFIAIAASTLFANCGGTPVLPGDLGKMTDGVLVPCEPIAGQQRSCLVLANPNNENIKVFDATTRQFLPAPRGYTQLGIPVGVRTSRLASAPGLDFVLALDVVNDTVYRIRTRGDTPQTPTFAVAAEFKAPANALNFALAKVGNDSAYSLIYVLPTSLRVSPIDNTTALQNMSSLSSFDIQFSHPISTIAVDHESGYLAVAFRDDGTFNPGPKSVAFIKLESITPGISESDFTQIYMKGFLSHLRLGTLRFDEKTIPFAFGIRSDALEDENEEENKYELVATRLDFPGANPVATKFAFLPTALYVPPLDSKPCCDGLKRWVAVMTVRGSFHYITLKDLVSDHENPIGLVSSQTLQLSDDTSLGSQAVFPTAIFGGQVVLPPGTQANDEGPNCQNRIFITFQSGLLASACEGQKGISKVGL
jgi:hypothetical protein